MDNDEKNSLAVNEAEAVRRETDKKSRTAAINTEKSFIVQAPAGSGKTSLLTQRFLALLAVVDRPEEILAMTFTNKAAGEMQDRILGELRKAADGKEPEEEYSKLNYELAQKALEHSQAKGWELTDNPGRLRIRTIDSFCAYASKCLPVSSRFGCNPSIEPDAGYLYEQAARNAVNHLLENEADPLTEQLQRSLIDECGNKLDSYETELAAMLQDRHRILEWIKDDVSDDIDAETGEEKRPDASCGYGSLRERVEQSWKEWQKELIEQLKGCNILSDEDVSIIVAGAKCFYEQRKDYKDDKVDMPALLKSRTSESDKCIALCRLAEMFDKEPLKYEDAPEFWRIMGVLLLDSTDKKLSGKYDGRTKAMPDSKEVKKNKWEAYNSFNAWLKDNKERAQDSICPILKKAKECLSAALLSDDDWQRVVRILNVFRLALWELHRIFAENSVCDYEEMQRGALLASDPESSKGVDKLSFDSPIKHILVDEYQDTSWSQYDLLNNLTCGWSEGDGRTLFCVGDPMQSIYRFRSSDVSVYLHTAENGLEEVKPEQLNLHNNFRTVSNLIEELDSIFKGIFPAKSSVETGAVEFSQPVAVKDENKEVTLEVRPVLTDDSVEKARENNIEADYDEILKISDSEYEAGLVVQEIKKFRKNGESCAVLLESKKLGDAILRILREYGIPCEQKEISALKEHQPVPVLLGITGILLDPLDRFSWICLMRSRLAGFTWKQICEVIERYVVKDPKDPAKWKNSRCDNVLSCLDDFAKVDDGDSPSGLARRCRRLYELFRHALSQRRGLSLEKAVEQLWYSLGGPAAYKGDGELAAAKQYFEFLRKTYDRHSGACWPEPAELAEDIDKLTIESPSADLNPVRMLTIHAAKGLEFDHVFLPGLGKNCRIKQGDKSLLVGCDFWTSGVRGTVVFPKADIEAEETGKKEAHPCKELAKDINNALETNEFVRLFYVAATRAKKSLHIYPWVQFNKDFSGIVPKNSNKILTGELWAELRQYAEGWKEAESEQDILPICRAGLTEQAASADVCTVTKTVAGLCPDWNEKAGLNILPGQVKTAQTGSVSAGAGSKYDSERSMHRRTVSGTAVHAALEFLAGYVADHKKEFEAADDAAFDKLGSEAKPGLQRVAARVARENGMADVSEVEKSVDKAVSNVLHSERGRWIITPYEEAYNEFNVRFKGLEIDEEESEDDKLNAGEVNDEELDGRKLDDGEFEDRRMDRVFISQDTVWVVDYKTSKKDGKASLEDFYKEKLEDYHDQLVRYRKAAEAIWPDKEVRSALYFPLLDGGEAFCEL